ncbi:YbcC family protein [Hoeflea sp.]|uniref:YbcC family protein n=1 Tax=Hoeflea sp. TaxID=1940281 RepID=UPI003A8F6B19
MTIEDTKKYGFPMLEAVADAAARQIPPLWPLASSVAVNPFLGQKTGTLAETGALLSRIGGVRVTMPRAWYRERLVSGEITDADLAAALASCSDTGKPADLAALKAMASETAAEVPPLPTIADLAAEVEGRDWPALLAERFGVWAAGYFDRGQALWAAPRGNSAWAAFRSFAAYDLTPEIIGLKGFARLVSEAPDRPMAAIARAVERLGLSEAALPTCFHQLLFSLGGWAQHARYELWQAELAGGKNRTIIDLLAVRLLWEEALYIQYEASILEKWKQVRAIHETPARPGESAVVDAILQEAAERAAQRRLSRTLAATPASEVSAVRPVLQAAFCIDVRSEVFRRALESVDPAIRTLGFAGFFGVSVKHRGFASDVDELRLPVLLNPAAHSCSGDEGNRAMDLAARYAARSKRAWGRFKLAAVSSFAFVEATGPVYAVKLVRDALGFHAAAPAGDPAPRFEPALDTGTKIKLAETVLRAMSLTDGFARIILLAGHGASVVNNPFASGLQCGACGGHSGEVNARLLAQLLNETEVRDGLALRGIAIPEDTLFVAALHDTTTDEVTLYDNGCAAKTHRAELGQIRAWLAKAGRMVRAERALRLPHAANAGMIGKRARDWAEVRPEWALAGCNAFIAAPRGHTAGRNLEGRAFLHDYDWHQDAKNGFSVLELILTAPVVVASWISLQYYGSTVAPDTFGAGNKLLHNVAGGIGVLEGNGGMLRSGLPWQSVHDGEKYVHEPLRLSVCVNAPREAINGILDRHEEVRALFDNRWLHLFAMNEEGCLAWRYDGNLGWSACDMPSEIADAQQRDVA